MNNQPNRMIGLIYLLCGAVLLLSSMLSGNENDIFTMLGFVLVCLGCLRLAGKRKK